MKKTISMEVVHQNCAGIDVGSRSHFVAIGQQEDEVREFGVYAEDLRKLSSWLKAEGIESVAMESTGNYWQNLYRELSSKGISVTLANGKHTKNAKGKKTDVKDARWIQQLHSLGLLTSSFLPDAKTEVLRTYCRHRTKMIEQKADTSHKMQKYLKLLNFRLDVVVRDVTGLTGLKIISQICEGILDPKTLAANRHFNCRKSEEEICKALHSNEREDFIFGLKQEYDRYLFYVEKIRECDGEIKLFLDKYIENQEEAVNLDGLEEKPYKRVNKNSIQGTNLNKVSYQYFGGVDLYAIPGVSHTTVLTIMSEIGSDGFKKFNSGKQFASWLRLAPNNKISGGKLLSHGVPRGSSRLKIALRNAANAIGRMRDTDLSRFFARIAFKKGRQSAITSTARKLAVIIWNMVSKGQQYDPTCPYLFLDQKRQQIAQIRKKISKFGIDPNELGVFSRPEYKLKYEKRTIDNQRVRER